MSKRIAILGAGPMGLAAAYQLVRDGHKPVIFEADDRVGGMSASFDFGGLEIERYYHFHCTSDQAFLDVIDELGLAHRMNWVETRMGYWYNDCIQPWGNPIALLKFKGLSLPAKVRYGLHAFMATKRNDWGALDKMEAASWIRRWVGDEAWEVLWRRLFDLKFYEYANNLSAAWIWSRIRRVGRSRSSIFREKLGYLQGGSQTLLNALQSSIQTAGGEIRLDSPVHRVIVDDAKVVAVRCESHQESFDTVISTIPLPYIERIIPDLPTAVLHRFKVLKNIAVVCVIMKLSKRVSENFWLNINDPEMDIPGLVEYSNLRPLKDHIVYVPFYMPGDHPKYKDSDEVFIEKVSRYVMKINPSIQMEDIIDVRVSRCRYAQPICSPGYLEGLPDAGLPIKGLWVADTSYYYPEDRGISESIRFGRRMALQATESNAPTRSQHV